MIEECGNMCMIISSNIQKMCDANCLLYIRRKIKKLRMKQKIDKIIKILVIERERTLEFKVSQFSEYT